MTMSLIDLTRSRLAAELIDDQLFKQPESNDRGDCPICCLPLPIQTLALSSCCGTVVCEGCSYAYLLRKRGVNIEPTCPFCRHPVPETEEEIKKNLMKRVEANDHNALNKMGNIRWKEGDYDGAFKYLTKAVELGNVDAHHKLSIMYLKGQGVEKDEKKNIFHLEQAAIQGHTYARYNLAMNEGRKGRSDRAVKHLIIAANLGDDTAIKKLMGCYRDGLVSKDDFAMALRAHKAAVDAMKSPQRIAAGKYYAEIPIRY